MPNRITAATSDIPIKDLSALRTQLKKTEFRAVEAAPAFLEAFDRSPNRAIALARGYAAEGMPAYVRLQEREFALEEVGYTATKHQREVGAGWFDEIAQAVSGGASSTLALRGSTEEAQFQNGKAASGH